MNAIDVAQNMKQSGPFTIVIIFLNSMRSKKSTPWTAFLIMFYCVINLSCFLSPLK